STGGMRFGGSGGQGWCPPRVGGCRCQQRPPPWVREHLPATRDHLMADELEVISDGEGIAIIGDSTAVDRFFAENDLESSPIDLARFLPSASTVNKAGAVANIGSQVVANAGRWVQLSEQSARVF